MEISEELLKEHGFLDAGGKWHCTACGACCKFNGCRYLQNDNLCSIYEDRPMICRTDVIKRPDIERAKACFLLFEFIEKGCKEEHHD